MTVHQPVRPAWTCGGCGAEWPCEPQRQALLVEYERARVSLSYLAAHFLDAVPELTEVPVAHLHRRFLGWAR
ncbi:flavin reductase [Micromonospora fluostatini]|uniref:Flavin reductase n=1 Tax=Micromonospora fluostatini TaxID=1629071 RepID=A0ABY2DJQ0_9ACTN|nr:flavin reductase [Micromonospora fluostatini]